MTLSSTSTAAPYIVDSSSLAAASLQTLRQSFTVVNQSTEYSDAVLSAVSAPGVRIRLGSTADPADALAFNDPEWARRVAQALYRGISSVYGVK